MLKIIAKSKIKEGRMEEYLDAVRALVEGSQAEEGNISYTLNQSRDDPNTVAFFEVWKDQAAFEFHTQTEHFTTILPKLGEFVESGEPAMFFTEIQL